MSQVLNRPKDLSKLNSELFTEALWLNKGWQVKWKISNGI